MHVYVYIYYVSVYMYTFIYKHIYTVYLYISSIYIYIYVCIYIYIYTRRSDGAKAPSSLEPLNPDAELRACRRKSYSPKAWELKPDGLGTKARRPRS